MTVQTVSKLTLKNWWVDAAIFSSTLFASITGIYFLFVPSGGYQGGRNPFHDMIILFDRHTWDAMHTWTGTAMIAAAVIHLAIHWKWVASMARKTWNGIIGKGTGLNDRSMSNLILNVIVGLSFLLTSISGVYFMFVQSSRWSLDPMIFFPKTTWSLLHTWSGVIFIAAATIHLVIHWRWVVNVTRRMLGEQIKPVERVSKEVLQVN